MKFCSDCGARVKFRIPESDTLPRYVCDACHAIHYQNPKIVVGCIPEWGDKILLCRRAIEPRYGLWTLPAGFMENGETLAEGALRETSEEAKARVEIGQLYALYNLPHISQVYALFRAKLLDLNFGAGVETLEVRLFSEHEVPWDMLAFTCIRLTLERYYQDRQLGEFLFKVGTIEPPASTKRD